MSKKRNFIESSGSTKAKEKNKVNIDRISKINIVLKLQESDLTCYDVVLIIMKICLHVFIYPTSSSSVFSAFQFLFFLCFFFAGPLKQQESSILTRFITVKCPKLPPHTLSSPTITSTSMTTLLGGPQPTAGS